MGSSWCQTKSRSSSMNSVRRRVGVGRVGAGALDGDLDVLALVDGVAVEHGAEGLELAAQRRRVGRVLLEELAHEADDVVESRPPERQEPTGHLRDQAPLDALAEAAPESAGSCAAVRRQPRRSSRGSSRARRRAGRAPRRPLAQRQLDPGRRRHVVHPLEERLGAVVVEAVLQVLEHHLLVRLGDRASGSWSSALISLAKSSRPVCGERA